MKKEILDNTGSVKSYSHSYNDIHIPQEAWYDILEASNKLKIDERNDKIDKLLNES